MYRGSERSSVSTVIHDPRLEFARVRHWLSLSPHPHRRWLFNKIEPPTNSSSLRRLSLPAGKSERDLGKLSRSFGGPLAAQSICEAHPQTMYPPTPTRREENYRECPYDRRLYDLLGFRTVTHRHLAITRYQGTIFREDPSSRVIAPVVLVSIGESIIPRASVPTGNCATRFLPSPRKVLQKTAIV